jgi:predicted nucleic acid-binding protein
MNDIFLDTVGLIAVWDTTDQWHGAANAAYRKLLSQGNRLFTTSAVLLECGNAASRRPYRLRVNALRAILIQEQLVLEPTVQDIEEAWTAYDRGDAGQAGIVDQISFVVMRRSGILDAFTNDHHFQAGGFATLF